MSVRTLITPSGGALVLVGKSASDNDKLTFDLSQKDDLWFHVKGVPGSHVLLRGDQLTQGDIQFAANVAAKYSKAKSASSVDVEYCSIWDVSKPKNSKAGLVHITNQTVVIAYPMKCNVS
jgi:predicted ribosome quality control (RQC) complex YloA/Tae2 family protein